MTAFIRNSTLWAITLSALALSACGTLPMTSSEPPVALGQAFSN